VVVRCFLRNHALAATPREVVAKYLKSHPDVEIEFWDSIKNSVRAQEYEAYLEQYPEGSFAALARARLDAIAEDNATMRDPQDREIELSFWESVRESANPALFRAYLEKYPKGEFGALAEIRLSELTLDGGSAG
jgi:hypothetical protein